MSHALFNLRRENHFQLFSLLQVVTVGREGEAAAFLSWHDPSPFMVNYVGVCTGWGATGSWIIEGIHYTQLLMTLVLIMLLLNKHIKFVLCQMLNIN